MIPNQHFQSKTLVCPYMLCEPVKRESAMSLTSVFRSDEELSNVDAIRVSTIQFISNDRRIQFEEMRFELAVQPLLHSCFEFCKGHAIAMPLISD